MPQSFTFSHLLLRSSILALLMYLHLWPGGIGTAADPDVFRGSHTAFLVLAGQCGGADLHLPRRFLFCQHWQWCGQSSPHLLLPICASLGQEGLCACCKGPEQEDPSPFCSPPSHFLLSRHSAAPWALDDSTATTARSADLHKSAAFPRAPRSRRGTLSPQTQGQTLPVLSQPRAHTNLLQQLRLI